MASPDSAQRTRSGRAAALVAAIMFLAVGVWTSPAWAEVQTQEVSVDRNGDDPARESGDPSISADGRYVAFWSAAPLIPGDGNGDYDVYVYDVTTDAMVLASVDGEGGDANGSSFDPSLSADGRVVAFESDAPDLVRGDRNGDFDVFVRDLISGITVRASVDTEGGDAAGNSISASISGDGRSVAFSSDGGDLVPGDNNGEEDVFVRDLDAGTTVRASVDVDGGDADEDSINTSISWDGRYVAFESEATDLIRSDRNRESDIFVRNLVAGITTRASVNTKGGGPNKASHFPSLSANGRYVAFHSEAKNLVEDDGNGFNDVFVRDLFAGATIRVSVDSAGGDANGGSTIPSISTDGRYVAFQSSAGDLVQGRIDSNHISDVYVRDVVAGATMRGSVNAEGGDPNETSNDPAISSDGASVAFESEASNLVPGPQDRKEDVFLALFS